MTHWSHQEPVAVRFGAGCLEELPAFAPTGPVLLVTSPGMTRRGVTHRVEGLLEGKEVVVFDEVAPNPTIQAVESARSRYQGDEIRGIVAIGGGSVLDTAKSLSLLFAPPNQNVPLDAHFEEGRPLRQSTPLPFVAIPTTAGTGSEVTPFATVWDPQRKKKQSLTTPHLHPSHALLDPELTLGLPPSVTLPSGLDALSHALESVWNHNATPLTRMYAQRAVGLILENLPGVLENGDSLPERTRMLEGSLLAGLAIAITRTALAHSISYPLTAHYGLTHGYACSFTLPALLRYNAQVDDGRLKSLAQALGYPEAESLADSVVELYRKTRAADPIKKVIPGRDAITKHLGEMFTPGRAGNNLRSPRPEEVRAVLEESAREMLDYPS